MENERDFLIIENLTQEEINESFEKLKKNLLRTFYEFRKRKNTDVKILDINYSTEKFIKINIAPTSNGKILLLEAKHSLTDGTRFAQIPLRLTTHFDSFQLGYFR